MAFKHPEGPTSSTASKLTEVLTEVSTFNMDVSKTQLTSNELVWRHSQNHQGVWGPSPQRWLSQCQANKGFGSKRQHLSVARPPTSSTDSQY